MSQWVLQSHGAISCATAMFAAVEELTGLSDEEAIAKAHALFSERKHLFEGFELWDRTRVLVRLPSPLPPQRRRLAASGALRRV